MNPKTTSGISGVQLLAAPSDQSNEILIPEALSFIVDLQRRFAAKRRELLASRGVRQEKLDAGERPDFLTETTHVRDRNWTVAPLPADLLDRRVEITGPVDRKMIINALNSGARVFMADFEDSNTPTWSNLIDGQRNLRDAIRRTIGFDDPKTGKVYKLNDHVAVFNGAPAGMAPSGKACRVDGEPMSGSLFDFGLYFWHNANELLARGSGPYFYLPKIESYLEARLWNDVFLHAQQSLGVKPGTIKATVLIETVLASFQMDEILFELREHSAGLNCGRWDYIFSFIKKFSANAAAVLPDRGLVTMSTHFMRSYSKLLIKTCHRREVHGMGGMAAYIPIKSDAAANHTAMEQVRADKEREVKDGHDGTWVAHPGLVPLATEIFDKYMPQPNQIARKLEDVHVAAADLLMPVHGTITETGLRQNIAVGIGYLESWLRGIGCVPLFNLMEDAATAEISRAQLWQWIHHQVHLSDGRLVDLNLFATVLDEELSKVRTALGNAPFEAGQYRQAARLLRDLVQSKKFVEFLTLSAYQQLNEPAASVA